MAKELSIPSALQSEIAKTYRKMDLEASMKTLVFKFLLANEQLCLSEGVPNTIYSKVRYKSPTKAHLIDLCCIPFLSEKLLSAFMRTLPSNIRKILQGLMWTKVLHEDVIRAEYGIEIVEKVKPSRRYSAYAFDYRVKREYHFFQINSETTWGYRGNDKRWRKFSLTIIPQLRKLLIQYSPKPKNYYLNGAAAPKTDFTYNGEKDIFLELPRLLVYYEQGNIKLTAKDRLVSGTVNKMQRKLKLAEFFENPMHDVLKNVRANAIASLLVLKKKLSHDGNNVDLIKKLFLLYQKKHMYVSFPRLLTSIKGFNSFYDGNLYPVEPSFFEILREMPLEGWVTIENIEEFIRYRELYCLPIDERSIHFYLYFEKEGKRKHHQNRYYIRDNHYEAGIVKPLLRANLFLFAAFGLVEVAYNQPDTTAICETYYSAYDELKAVRLTALGAYIIRKKRKYVQPEETKPIPLILSKDSLMILSDEKDLTADILLQTYTQKVGSNRYQTDASIFLSDCSTKKQLQDKISLFKKTVSKNLPPNWKAFFDGLLDKVEPFENVGAMYVVLKIAPSNRALIQLIVQDVELRKLAFKGEGFHIFVLKSKLTQFKKRLKEFGYLFDNA